MGYTGNNHHARKEEMIHDRELIYDAKKQLHRADESYKDSPSKMYGDPAAKNITKVLSEGAKHNAAPKMSAELSDPVLENDIRSNRMGGYAGDASGAPDPTRPNTSNDPAPMMKVLGKPALMMKKGIASMCGMKK